MRRLLVLLAILTLLAPAGLASAAACSGTECPCCPLEDADGPQLDRGCCCETDVPTRTPFEHQPDRADAPRGPELPDLAFAVIECGAPVSNPVIRRPARVQPRSRTGPHSVQSLHCVFLC